VSRYWNNNSNLHIIDCFKKNKYFGYVKHKISVFSQKRRDDERTRRKEGGKDEKENKRNKRKIDKIEGRMGA
jgi:hypothetical protein